MKRSIVRSHPQINLKLRAIAFRGVKVGNAIAKSINWHYLLKFFE
ncbi:hypothetical protein [Anabaena sp. UHCC 0253]|nr:hypothetical protein [Anabaena sp. UHCC 0253]